VHRNPLKALLGNYHPDDIDEKRSKQQMLEFLEAYSDSFDRSCIPGHFTASGWLLNKDGTRALLLLHKKFDEWLQPGGHCDGDSDVLRVAIKETQEESGIIGVKPVFESIFDIDVHLIPPYGSDPEHYHYDVRFLLQVQSDESLILSEESHDLRWFGKDKNVLPTQERSIMRMFEKWERLAC
jgi:8-oxo-dGTP pyrophosphatase MutT (NUDIX family)